jgi:hypothetical protein
MKKKKNNTTEISADDNGISESEKSHKIQSLREMIGSAEKTIQSAKMMLLQLEGKKKTGRKRKSEDESDGTIIEGNFDGQIMIGTDGKQYPVPANYASKSKLVEGDMLKLTITPDGSFIYKQIGPIERKHALGVVSQDESGNFRILAEGKPYRVLLASITYFRAEPGDEVAIVMPRDIDSSWASIENVLQKGRDNDYGSNMHKRVDIFSKPEEEPEEKNETSELPDVSSVADEWTADIAAIEKEIQEEQAKKSAE